MTEYEPWLFSDFVCSSVGLVKQGETNALLCQSYFSDYRQPLVMAVINSSLSPKYKLEGPRLSLLNGQGTLPETKN